MKSADSIVNHTDSIGSDAINIPLLVLDPFCRPGGFHIEYVQDYLQVIP